jgi:hypothetical protein
MSIYILHNRQKILFRIFGQKASEVAQWRKRVDKEIFMEQYETGLYRGKMLLRGNEYHEKVMKWKFESGNYRPYYGAIGGGYTNMVHPLGTQCLFRKTNGLSEESFEFKAITQDAPPENDYDDDMKFLIETVELESLRQWEFWIESECLSGRYQFEFTGVSLGRGWIIQVLDLVTESKMDITNYDLF